MSKWLVMFISELDKEINQLFIISYVNYYVWVEGQ